MKNKFPYISAIFIFFNMLAIHLQAQQLPHYSQYMINDYVMNPAVGGKMPYFEAKSNNRSQWVGITDAPRTYILSINGPNKSSKVGVGGYLFTDITGPTRRTGINASYAYHIKLNESMKLSLGLSAGLLQFAVDGSKITLHDPNDLVISNGYQSVLIPDLGAGIYFYGKSFYLGASSPQIYKSKLKFFDYATSTLSKIETHYYFTGGFKFTIAGDLAMEPSTVIKYVKPVQMQYDIGGRFLYKDMIWAGGAYRNLDAVTILAGYIYRDYLTIGYSYDFTTSHVKSHTTGTHEITLGVRFRKSQMKSGENL